MVTMKIVVQNDAKHPLTRRSVEELLPKLPSHWVNCVDSILICALTTITPTIHFYRKSRQLAVTGPVDLHQLDEVISELLLAFSIVAEKGYLPNRISASDRQNHSKELVSLFPKLGKCD